MSVRLLGLDCGLTVTKAVVFDEDGNALGIGSTPSRQSTPQTNWVEKDPDEQWQSACGSIQEALGEAGVSGEDITMIAPTAHGDGLYVLDEDLRPARPAIPSLDGRAGDTVRRFESEGISERALELVGETPFEVQAPALLGWLQEHEPDTYARVAHVLFCKDWLKLCLTGRLTTDPTEASAGLTETRTQEHSDETWRVYGLEEMVGTLPEVVRSYDVAGEVSDEAAKATGLAAGTPVVSGLHDCDASALGVGSVRPGQLTMIAGTFSINEAISDDPVSDARVFCRNWVDAGQYMNMANSASSATNLEWFVQQLSPHEIEKAKETGTSPFAFVGDEVTEVLGDDSRVLFLPYLYGSPQHPDGTAVLFGLKGWHTRGHILRAMFEGIAFGHRLHVDALRDSLELSEARLAGGGARSPVWAQVFADTVGLPVSVTDAPETGALGAAICAGVAAGLWETVAEGAERCVRVDRTFEPDPERQARLDDDYERYLELATALEGSWERAARPAAGAQR